MNYNVCSQIVCLFVCFKANNYRYTSDSVFRHLAGLSFTIALAVPI